MTDTFQTMTQEMSELSETTRMFPELGESPTSAIECHTVAENKETATIVADSHTVEEDNETATISGKYTSFVSESLSFGRYPYPPREMTSQLEESGYNVFIDLTCDDDQVPPYCKYISSDSEYIHIPLPKKSPTPAHIQTITIRLGEIYELIAAGRRVYVHDRGGHDRAPAVSVVLLMMWGYTLESSLEIVNDAHLHRRYMKKEWREKGAPRGEYRDVAIRLAECLKSYAPASESSVIHPHPDENLAVLTDSSKSDDVTVHTGSFQMVSGQEYAEWQRIMQEGKQMLLSMKEFTGMMGSLSNDSGQQSRLQKGIDELERITSQASILEDSVLGDAGIDEEIKIEDESSSEVEANTSEEVEDTSEEIEANTSEEVEDTSEEIEANTSEEVDDVLSLEVDDETAKKKKKDKKSKEKKSKKKEKKEKKEKKSKKKKRDFALDDHGFVKLKFK